MEKSDIILKQYLDSMVLNVRDIYYSLLDLNDNGFFNDEHAKELLLVVDKNYNFLKALKSLRDKLPKE
jgi:hypothetical protein